MNASLTDFEHIGTAFGLTGKLTACKAIESGHINNTYCITYENEEGQSDYLLQQINVNVFKNPDELMENIISVTAYLRKKIEESGGDTERETLTFLPACDGKYYYCDDDNRYWRICNFVGDSNSFDTIETPSIFYNAGNAFGIFQRLLADFPSSTLHDTIPDFHDTRKRFAALKKAIEDNLSGRLETVRDEIDFACEREADASVLVDMISEGKLPIRVTHNDTKLNNILFDSQTGKALCVIDLDTVMPGLSLYDFGDSIRFGANTASEDEKDASKVAVDLELYESFTKGFLKAAGKSLTENEINNLAFASKLMTYECGIRFLTDYLNGDVYFKTAYPEHNLVRCRTQFALVADMEKHMDEMQSITLKAAEE